MDTYGKRLEAALIDTGKDRKWFAEKIGISEQALSQVILGSTKFLNAYNHEKAVEVLGCSGKWLTTGDDAARNGSEWPFALILPSQYKQLDPAIKRRIESELAGEWLRVQSESAGNS